MMEDARREALDYADRNREATLAQLVEFLGIPSVSQRPADRENIRRAAEWIASRLESVPTARTEIVSTDGNPVVYAESLEAGESAPTVMFYGHYDVQSAAPLDAWDNDPYEPVTSGDELYARGASDNKGMIMACVAAVEAAARSGGLPINVKFMIEGEEEIGSVSLPSFLSAHREMLSCDFVLNPDVGMLGKELPTIFYGLRGMFSCRLKIRGPSQDLHSGGFGGIVRNPIHALCELVAGLHDDEGRVVLPGFYESVRPLTDEERAVMASLPLDEESYLRQSGVPELWGDSDFAPVERAGGRPALDVVCMEGGTRKAAIPSEAEALLTIRLVPDQTPAEVHAQLVSHLKSHVPSSVRWNLEDCEGFPASITDRDAPGVKALARSLEAVWGRPPVYHRSGGSIAAVGQLQETLGVDSVLTGFSLPDDRIHGPNEKLHLPTWSRGVKALVHFLYELAEPAASR
ncbi:MAG: dipeptidase [Candidatus Eisenbacteria bacterium]|nr:dipeptidase [Candidatus Eisenbacteria bacterium]